MESRGRGDDWDVAVSSINKPAVRAPAARPAAAASTRDGWALCRRRRRRRREQAAGRSRCAPAARLAGRRRTLRPRARCSYRYLSAPLTIEFGAAAEACGVVLRCWVLLLVPSCVLVSVGIAAAPVVVVSTAPRVGVRARDATATACRAAVRATVLVVAAAGFLERANRARCAVTRVFFGGRCYPRAVCSTFPPSSRLLRSLRLFSCITMSPAR